MSLGSDILATLTPNLHALARQSLTIFSRNHYKIRVYGACYKFLIQDDYAQDSALGVNLLFWIL